MTLSTPHILTASAFPATTAGCQISGEWPRGNRVGNTTFTKHEMNKVAAVLICSMLYKAVDFSLESSAITIYISGKQGRVYQEQK